MAKHPLITVYIDEETRETLRCVCFEKRINLSSAVRAALSEWLAKWDADRFGITSNGMPTLAK